MLLLTGGVVWATACVDSTPPTNGYALWTTTVILVAGFGVLGFSDFKMNSDLGILTAVTLLNAIIMDFLLVPSILMFIDKEKVCNCDACR